MGSPSPQSSSSLQLPSLWPAALTCGRADGPRWVVAQLRKIASARSASCRASSSNWAAASYTWARYGSNVVSPPYHGSLTGALCATWLRLHASTSARVAVLLPATGWKLASGRLHSAGGAEWKQAGHAPASHLRASGVLLPFAPNPWRLQIIYIYLLYMKMVVHPELRPEHTDGN